jgi:hypothetical protein
MLVWSDARNAKGEKGTTGCCLKHTLKVACVPNVSLVVANGLQGDGKPINHTQRASNLHLPLIYRKVTTG